MDDFEMVLRGGPNNLSELAEFVRKAQGLFEVLDGDVEIDWSDERGVIRLSANTPL